MQALEGAGHILNFKGYGDEVEHFMAECGPVLAKGRKLDIFNDEQDAEAWKRTCSLVSWAGYLVWGEKIALSHLPFLLLIDCAFFLRQRWVSDLIAQWHRQGEQQKVNHVFFGTPKRGIRSYQLARENRIRDIKIANAIETLRKAGAVRYMKTLRFVTKHLPEIGVKDRLSVAAVRSIIDKHKAGSDPLISLFKPPADR
jgi:hypothetical protein